jgi:hypothetical protein
MRITLITKHLSFRTNYPFYLSLSIFHFQITQQIKLLILLSDLDNFLQDSQS